MGLFDAPLRLVYESFKMRHLYRNWVARVGYCLDTEQGYFGLFGGCAKPHLLTCLLTNL